MLKSIQTSDAIGQWLHPETDRSTDQQQQTLTPVYSQRVIAL